MPKIYNVVFQSILPSQTTIGEFFYYDWGQLPQGEYKVTFSFFSGIAYLVNSSIANIYVDLGQQTQIVGASALSYKAGYLGSLRFSATGASGSLFAAINDNPPTYLMNRPTNNRVFVEIHANTGTFETNYSPVPAEYTLCMSFELQE